MGTRALVLASLLLVLPGPATADRLCLDDVDVCIELLSRGALRDLVVHNGTEAPYSVRVALIELTNLKPLVRAPFRAVVRPGEDPVVGSLSPVTPGEPTSLRYEWKAALGSLLARHENAYRYRMPFGGTEQRFLSQGVGGSFSHKGAGQYAFDFTMPWGTPVVAARSGVVVEVVDGNTASGLRKRHYDQANKVDVLHADGTLATYAHLRHGAVVEVGKRVSTGDLIGHSGDTGFSGGPHLHFMVWQRAADLTVRTVPIRFHDGTAEGFIPGSGVAYAPACSKGGTGCAEGERPPADEAVPAARAGTRRPAVRRDDGACACSNGAVIHVDLPCNLVCGR